MGRTQHPSPQREQIPVKVHYRGSRLEVPVPVYTNRDTAANEVNSLWVHGFGAGRRAVANVLAAQHEAALCGGSVVLPYGRVPVSMQEAFTYEAIPQIVYGLGVMGRVALIGESRGTGAVARGGAQITEQLHAVGLLEPAFLNSAALAKTEPAAVRSLLWRLGPVNVSRLKHPFEAGGRETLAEMGSEIGAIALREGIGGVRRSLRTMVDLGVSDRTQVTLRHIADDGVPIDIVAGEYDPVYPGQELQVPLRKLGLDGAMQSAPVAHVSPALAEAQQAVRQMVGLVRAHVPEQSGHV